MNNCRICGIKLVAGDNYYKSYLNLSNYICKNCKREQDKIYRKNYCVQVVKIQQELKINGCAICGYDKCIRALEFHHTNPEDKEFTLKIRNLDKSPKILAEELNKCILLCSNCHREIEEMEG